MPCVTQIRKPTAKASTLKVAVSKKVGGRRPLALNEGRLSLTKMEKGREKSSNRKGYTLHKEGNHSQDHTTDRKIGRNLVARGLGVEYPA